MSITTSNKKLVLIATPVLLVGGTEIHMLSVVRALVQERYHVIICCYYDFDSAVVEWFKSAGAEVILMDFKRHEGLFYLAKGLMRLLREIKPDIIHVQYLAPGLIPIIVARIVGIPTIFSTVHIAGDVAYGKQAKYLLRIAARLCTVFFCVSKGVEEFWFGNSFVLNEKNVAKDQRHFTIYNSIDTVKIHEIISNINREEVKTSLGISDKPVIGIVGRLTYQKGQDILFDAMGEIIEKFPDVILIVIGEGPDRMKLEDKVKSLGIENHILWLGVQQQDRVFQLYSIMDVLAMPSRYEGFGLTAAEAMAARIPVVGSKVEGLTEIIQDGITGYLVPVNNSNKLAEAIINLLIDPEKAKGMGRKGFERVNELFSIERFSKSWLAAYRSLQNDH
jgi:L-malate glycosyltransferase